MKIIYENCNSIENSEPICLTIGNFDGVHKGHQALIHEVLNEGLKGAVMTFDPHPSSVLRETEKFKVLTPIEHKIQLMDTTHVDYLFIVKFDKDFAHVSKEDFILLLKRLQVKTIVCGDDFSFGHKASGKIQDLLPHFNVKIVPKELYHETRISSTYIKDTLLDGNVYKASVLLGRPYAVRGLVAKGNQIGRQIGFPTANVITDSYLIPHTGVYHVSVIVNNKHYFGMLNIGYNPTINYSETKKVEVHIFDFSEDIYGQEIEIQFHTFLRNEKKFESKDALIAQLSQDKAIILSNIKNGIL